jgi:hypothetical protein
MENIQSKLNSVQVAKTHLSFSTAFFIFRSNHRKGKQIYISEKTLSYFILAATVYKSFTSILKFNRSRYENYRRLSSVNPTVDRTLFPSRAGQYCKEV